MMKKLLSFVCCLLPFSAGAVVVNERTPGTGAAYGGNGALSSINIDMDTVEVIKDGTGIVISKDSDGVSGGLTVASNVIIGQGYSGGGGQLFAGVDTAPTFTIQSDGNISVGALLQVLSGRTLGITTTSVGTLIDASFGSIEAAGALNVQNIKNFASGNIDSATALTISANTMTAGAIDVTGGPTDINVAGNLTMAQFQTTGSITNINAGSINSGSIQNGKRASDDSSGYSTNDASEMTITVAGNLDSTGSIENSGTLMKILKSSDASDAVNVTVAGTMKNDSNNGTLTMVVDSLTVNGGNTTNRSLVSAGNLNLTVAGETNLAYGFDLSAMRQNNNNEFYLKTGTLKFGEIDAANVDADDAWLQVFANDLNKFYLEITDGNVTAGAIINGARNTDANMTVIGNFVDATSVTNKGTLKVSATGTPSTDAGTTDPEYALNISGTVQADADSVTDIISASSLNIAGTVSNSGQMLINANDVNLSGVINSGTQLEIKSLTDATGTIKISSTVTNSNGELIVNARQIDIDGIVTNVSGITTIKGSDRNSGSVVLGGVDVQGGAFNLDALIGGVSVDGAVAVTDGVLNIGQNTHNLTAGAAITFNGDVVLHSETATDGAGDVNIAATGASGFVLSSTADDATGVITIGGNLSTVDDSLAHSAQFDAKTIIVEQDVTVEDKGKLIFGRAGRASTTAITGDVTAKKGGALELYSDDTDVGSLSGDGLFTVHGSQITANTGAIDIDGNLWFNTNASDSIASGMVVKDTGVLTLKTVATGADIYITGGATITSGNTLTLDSAHDATIGGRVVSDGTLSVFAAGDANFENLVTNNKSLTVYAKSIETQAIENTGTLILGDAEHVADTITTGDITNSDDVTINGTTVETAAIESTAGAFDVTANSLHSTYITVSGGTATLDAKYVVASENIKVSGDWVQGTVSASNAGMLNVVNENMSVSAKDLTVEGAFRALNNAVVYNISGNITVGDAFTVADGANLLMMADGYMTSGALTNAGGLTLGVNSTDGMKINGAIENTGNLSLHVNGLVTADSFIVNTGKTTLMGDGMTLTGAFGAADKSSMLYHGGTQTLSSGDFYIANSGYTLTASNVALAGIEQTSTTTRLTINTSDLKIANDVNVADMRVAANPSDDWLQVDVGGSVIGGAQFIGLESMKIGGDYRFDNNSQINAAILPYATEIGPNTTTNNYWSTVSLNDDNTLGKITNAADGAALIQVAGQFSSTATVNAFDITKSDGLGRPQVGLVLRDIVDPGTAIWLLHAEQGFADESLTTKIRNVNVSFCNADGTECFGYKTGLPAYISVRDSAGDGLADSLYVVFDPRFGGPVEVFKIQPIVARTDDYTTGEYVSAGAIDDLVAGQLVAHGFYKRTPIEAIPLIFKGTNLSTVANELYDRMEYYNLERDGTALARFSRLFQPRELEQIAGSVVLNEHTNFRSFEDRMFDEFIWNRHRNLKKAWVDVDYGMFYQDATDGKHINGDRFNIAGGFDWQESQTLLLGLTGRISRMSSDNSDSMDLGYRPDQHIAGHVKTKVSDTDIGLGGYLMKILGQKTRVYGNGFLDIHLLDVDREQNFVSKISGSGTAFSLTSEWGLLHDWLNQYIVGNMYARVGYNFGFDVTERAAGQSYMNMKSDGYFVFTPGYSLTAQKRIYPSVWFQVRPYASIGVEYDVLGAPDSVKYKFAPANSYTTYDVNIDPLWANIGGGVEMLSAAGIQFGIDYRYQYNQDIQLHNIKVSGSYRF